MIDVDDIRLRYGQAAGFLDERGRRLFGANEALAHGHGGVSATARATGLARSTINRGVVQLLSGGNDIGARVRRRGGGRKSAVAHQPGLPLALEALIEDAIRGDPATPLRWVSRSLRHLVKALAAQGFTASQRVVARQSWLGQCRRRRRYWRLRRREHPPLVAEARPSSLSQGSSPGDHGGLWRQQRAAGEAMET